MKGLIFGKNVKYRGYVNGLRISSVDDTAFIDNAGATIPTYADGNHLIEIYDSSNRMDKGILKAPTTIETLGAEINSGTCVALTLYKITATEANHYGAGLVVGSYFTSAGTETNDANNKVKQVTAGASAATIVNAKGGTTYRFSYKDASFVHNAATNFCIIKRLR